MTSETDLDDVKRQLEFRRLVRENHEREQREEQRAEQRDRWLRGIGYVTRTLVYLIVAVLLWVWLKPTEDLSERALASLTLKEIGSFVVFICVLIFWGRLFFNYDEDFIDWEVWGKFCLGLFAMGAVAAVWLGYQ